MLKNIKAKLLLAFIAIKYTAVFFKNILFWTLGAELNLVFQKIIVFIERSIFL